MEDKILKILDKHPGEYVSGEKICKSVGVSRASIWKHIETMRHLGYRIEGLHHLGYKLLSRPDRLIPEEIKCNLNTKFMGCDVHSYESLDSTNDTAYQLAVSGAPEGTVVVAEQQRKGKGRQKRHWHSPKGGIYLSCVLRPEIEPKEIAKVTLAAAVAACEALRDSTGLEAMIKWPNDILVDGKKICGILTEMKAEQDRVNFLVLGIGINVNSPQTGLLSGATSVEKEVGGPVRKVDLTQKLLVRLEENIILFKKGSFTDIIKMWHRLSLTVGEVVKVHCHDEVIEGQAVDLDENGALVIRLDSGIQRRVLSGDVALAH